MRQLRQEKVADYVDNHDIYLFGPMGVGKTTFVDSIRQIAPVNYVSMGEITRDAIVNGDQKVTKMIEKGGKLPLESIKDIITPHISRRHSYILDGVPRHPDEAEWIKRHAIKRHIGAVALTLSADNNIILDRIKRRLERKERSESPERIASRLEVYKNNQKIILKALRPALQDVIELDTSNLSPEEVFEEFHERI